MRTNLKYWRQNGPPDSGHFETHTFGNVDKHASFLEILDVLDEELLDEGKEPLAFDSDCRKGICGQCGIVINGDPHRPRRTTTCQLHVRAFKDGDTITLEPWRSRDFPVIKGLVVGHSAFDHIVQAGGYISVNTGAAPEAYSQLIPKGNADRSFETAACIGCGACVTTRPNGSAMFFTSVKVVHLGPLL